MERYRDMYKNLFKEFEMYCPYLAERVVEWYPVGQWEIVVKTDLGEKYSFSWGDNAARRIFSDRVIGDDLDEQHYRDEFSRRLREKMCRVGITKEDLAEELGVSMVTISKYLNGKSTPNSYNLSRIARLLKCSPSELSVI